MKNLVKGLSLILVIGLAGCGTQSQLYLKEGSIANGSKSTKVDYVATDAKLRLVSYIDAGDSFDARTRRIIKPAKLVCAEPSPDVASAFQYAIDVALKQSSGNSVGVSASFAESIMQLGKRVATIQLLRDELSDLCRIYANGAISGATYNIRLSRLDKKMVTLLSSEAAAGALADTGRALAGGASLSKTENPADVKAAQEAVNKAKDELVAASKSLANNTDAAKKESLQTALDEKAGALESANKDLAIAALANSSKALTSGAQLQSGNGGATVSMTVNPSILEDIQDNFLRVDDASTIIDACLTRMTEDSMEQADVAMDSVKAAYKTELATDAYMKKVFDRLSSEVEKKRKEGNISNPLTMALAGLQEEYRADLDDKKTKAAITIRDAEEVKESLQKEKAGQAQAEILQARRKSEAEKKNEAAGNKDALDRLLPLLSKYLGEDNSMSFYCQSVALPAMYSLMDKQAGNRKEIELKKYETGHLLEIRKAEAQKAVAELEKAKIDKEASDLKSKLDAAEKAKSAAEKVKVEAEKAKSEAENQLKVCNDKLKKCKSGDAKPDDGKKS